MQVQLSQSGHIKEPYWPRLVEDQLPWKEGGWHGGHGGTGEKEIPPLYVPLHLVYVPLQEFASWT